MHLGRRSFHNTLVRIAQIFPHRYRQIAQPGIRQLCAEFRDPQAASREEKGWFSLHDRRHCITLYAVGRDKQPVLPGAMQCSSHQLYTGNSRTDNIRNILCLQQRNKIPAARIKSRVPAVDDGGFITFRPLQRFQNFLRFGCRHAALCAAVREIFQQPGRTHNALCPQKALLALLRPGSLRTATQCQ